RWSNLEEGCSLAGPEFVEGSPSLLVQIIPGVGFDDCNQETFAICRYSRSTGRKRTIEQCCLAAFGFKRHCLPVLHFIMGAVVSDLSPHFVIEPIVFLIWEVRGQ